MNNTKFKITDPEPMFVGKARCAQCLPSGVFTPTQSRQAHKASSALYMIKKRLLRNRDFSIKPTTALKLHIKPILLHYCEVWAPAGWINSTAHDPHVLNLINLDKTESVHTIFL